MSKFVALPPQKGYDKNIIYVKKSEITEVQAWQFQNGNKKVRIDTHAHGFDFNFDTFEQAENFVNEFVAEVEND